MIVTSDHVCGDAGMTVHSWRSPGNPHHIPLSLSPTSLQVLRQSSLPSPCSIATLSKSPPINLLSSLELSHYRSRLRTRPRQVAGPRQCHAFAIADLAQSSPELTIDLARTRRPRHITSYSSRWASPVPRHRRHSLPTVSELAASSSHHLRTHHIVFAPNLDTQPSSSRGLCCPYCREPLFALELDLAPRPHSLICSPCSLPSSTSIPPPSPYPSLSLLGL